MKQLFIFSIAVLLLSCSSQEETSNVRDFTNIPLSTSGHTFGPTLTTPMSSTSEEAKAFRNTEPGILFMMEVNRNRPDAGIPFDEAFANIENGISAIANNTSEYEVIARSYGYTYLLHYYSTVEPQNSQLIDNQSLSKLTNFLLTETPSNIREILPALLRLEGTWSNKELSNASKKVAIAAEEALAEYDMSEVGASRSELSKPLQDVLSLQKEQIQFLQSWSANM